jgi:hypothetical protein
MHEPLDKFIMKCNWNHFLPIDMLMNLCISRSKASVLWLTYCVGSRHRDECREFSKNCKIERYYTSIHGGQQIHIAETQNKLYSICMYLAFATTLM